MTDTTSARRRDTVLEDDPKVRARRMWAPGSFARIAELMAPLGRDLVAAAGIAPGIRVLDVGAGTGNAAIPAAEAGARVTASDLTPELLEVGRTRARGLGLDLDWVEADAEDLPFPTASFDVVLSCLGAMFAPDHTRTAAELGRVCRPGGTIAMANWTPDGYGGAFFGVLARYAPPPPGAVPPTAWGDPDHVQRLLGDHVDDLRCEPRTLLLEFTGPPEDLFQIYRTSFGPVLATRDLLAGDPSRIAALDRDLLDFLRAENTGTNDSGRYEFEFLSVTARRRQ